MPKKARKQKIKANTWYAKDHKKLAKKVKKAFKGGKHNLGESWVYYKKIARKYKALCRKSRVSSWRKYKETRQTVDDIVKLMNITQKKKQTNINTFFLVYRSG